jgi:hypothetical protein
VRTAFENLHNALVSIYSIYRVGPRSMVTIARFLSWLPDLRPVRTRRLILDGGLGQDCVNDLRVGKGLFEGPLYLVGPTAATLIIDAYLDTRLPLKDGAKPGSTARAKVYARSPLFWPGNPGEPVHVNVRR